eukprot:CAMPEP_0173378586 /NCGR_PEP_ID=MMETSP1356-20130122/1734_1 /TAXON_ID=77927 ORGANISM="Hemiselmis virescens, Strain PCC157" /NCGR_SAMPLE_ID=MMETSP1356 /ASSEMBLY_ACC=CAM_ASM_000847 /LENGTH=236 /DNA_ID=CAMNT_0014331703 /DNA_START=71 /DNA_END=777 /DNA_ORIENTATION=+
MPPFIVSVAKWTQADLRKKASREKRLQMITIGYSHYCEFGRFALLVGGVPFDDMACIPGQHVLPTLALRFSGDKPVTSDSTAMTQVGTPPESLSKAERSSRATATPVAVTADGDIVADSWGLAAMSGLAPCDSALKEVLDAKIAVDARHVAYFYFLKRDSLPIFHDMGAAATDSWVWGGLWQLGMKHKLSDILSKAFAVNDVAAKDAAVERLKQAFELIDERYMRKLGSNKYLGGG